MANRASNGHSGTANGHSAGASGQPAPSNGHSAASNGHDHQPHPSRYESPIGPDEVYDQEADEAAYNEAMYPAYDDSSRRRRPALHLRQQGARRMRWQRRMRTALTVMAISIILTTQVALAADPQPGPTNPTGFADLLPTPDLTHGDTRTLFEQYSPMVYGLDFERSIRDPIQA